VIEDADGFRSGLSVSRDAVCERHLGATPVRVWPVAPKLPGSQWQLPVLPGSQKTQKNPRFSGFCGRQRMLSDVIGSGQMVEPGGIEPPSISPTLQDLRT
jgi:hypothetical protein